MKLGTSQPQCGAARSPGKARMLGNILEEPYQSDVWPSQWIQSFLLGSYYFLAIPDASGLFALAIPPPGVDMKYIHDISADDQGLSHIEHPRLL